MPEPSDEAVRSLADVICPDRSVGNQRVAAPIAALRVLAAGYVPAQAVENARREGAEGALTEVEAWLVPGTSPDLRKIIAGIRARNGSAT